MSGGRLALNILLLVGLVFVQDLYLCQFWSCACDKLMVLICNKWWRTQRKLAAVMSGPVDIDLMA